MNTKTLSRQHNPPAIGAAWRSLIASTALAGIMGLSVNVQAHPSYGLVRLPDGTLLFADVLHNEGTIWRYNGTDGLTKLLTHEHCHFLYRDAKGSVWGTDHDYLPELETNRNSLWKLAPSGKRKQIVIAPTTDASVFSGVNFVVDRQGQIYYPHDRQILRRHQNGKPTPFIDHRFGRIMSLQMDQYDRLYLTDTYESGGSLFRIEPNGKRTRLATDLKQKAPVDPPFPEDRFNLLFAVNVSAEGTAWVASSGGRQIVEIAPSGTKDIIFRSESPWYPVAGLKADNALYVMEAGYQSGIGNFGPRILRVKDGQRKILITIDAPDKFKENR